MEDVIRGTEVKYNLNIQPVGGVSMSTFDFQVMAYALGTAQKNVIPKRDCTEVDNNNYVVPVDTSPLGLGQLILDVYAYIPDQDFSDNLRTEIIRLETEQNIIQ